MGESLLSKIHPQFMEHSNGSVMHTSTQACFLYFFYNPSLSLFNSKNTCHHSFFTCIGKLHVHAPFRLYQQLYQSFTYCSIKYTSKKGLEFMRLLTVELCSIKKSVLQDLYVLCNINAGSITLREALHDALMCDYRLIYMYG